MDAQRAQIEAFAKQAGYNVKRTICEGASARGEGNAPNRPGLQEAIRTARQNQWPIIVASLDRLSRMSRDVEEIIRVGTPEIVVANLGEQGNVVVLRSEAARAEREGDMISERTRKALAEKKRAGVRLGNRTNLPEAQRKGADQNRARGLARKAEFEAMWSDGYITGAQTAKDFADFFNQRGYRTARGGPWTKANVHRMLRNTSDPD
jgi:DNA invertase Pin-like site-specific DNA recombinase